MMRFKKFLIVDCYMDKRLFHHKKVCSNGKLTIKKGHSSKISLQDILTTSPMHFQTPLNELESRRITPRQAMQKQRKQSVNKDRNKNKENNHRFSMDCLSNCFTTSVTPKRNTCGDDIEINRETNHRENFRFVYQIGFGGFGKVWKVLDLRTKKSYAMKEISKHRVLEKKNVDSVMNQNKILRNLRNPFIINMKESFQDSNNLYLIMDYLRGADLRYHICYKEYFTENEIKFMISNIILGLAYVHANNIIHRDIKPENIVFEENGYLRITDFGIAKMSSSENNRISSESSGTPGYMAPEILCKNQYSFESDYFALGVILYEIIAGKRPYEGKGRTQIRQKIMNHQARIPQPLIPKGWSPHLSDFINRLLQRNPQDRLGYNGIKQLKNHKWLADVCWKKLERKEFSPPFAPHAVCETHEYLEEIVLYNKMNSGTGSQNLRPIGHQQNKQFADYFYKYDPTVKNRKFNRKIRRVSQKKLF